MGLDTIINSFMQGIENNAMTSFSKVIDVAFDPVILVVVSVLITAMLFVKDKRKQGLFFISIMGIAAVLIKGFKFLFDRARPANAILEETSHSFPSGHATIAIVFFGMMAFLLLEGIKKKKNFKYRKISIIFTASSIALISGFTRIYLRVHWLSDVVAGFILGGIILVGGIIIYRKK